MVSQEIKDKNMEVVNRKIGDVDNFLGIIYPYVDFSQVKLVLDIGSRDALQSIQFSKYFDGANVIAFEADPNNVEICKQNIEKFGLKERVTIVGKAVSNKTGTIKFYAVDMEGSRDKNNGVGSMFKLLDKTPNNWHWRQKEIEVDSTSLDEFFQGKSSLPDLLWCDVQGAELLVFQGAKEVLKNVKAIYTECGNIPYYDGHTMYSEINQFLIENGFVKIHDAFTGHEFERDYVYVRKELV